MAKEVTLSVNGEQVRYAGNDTPLLYFLRKA